MTHTPGPWSYEFDEYGGYDCMTAGYIIQANGQTITVVDIGDYNTPLGHDDSTSWPEVEADAKLIAAAPDLLKACKTTATIIESHPDFIDRDGTPLERAYDSLYVAIAKAT